MTTMVKKNNYMYLNTVLQMSGLQRSFAGSSRWQQKKRSATTTAAAATTILCFTVVGILFFAGWIDVVTPLFSSSINWLLPSSLTTTGSKYPLKCPTQNTSPPPKCPTNYYPITKNDLCQSKATCPDYFRWIHEDLRHWRETGITREMIEKAHRSAHFKLVILDGKAHVVKYRKALQTRDVFTLWGILQLLRFYPGRLPDLEMIFDCDDRPVVRSKDYRAPNSGPPPLFRYCSDPWNLDIVFPDWSFWGWAETNIKPWKQVLKDIKEGNKRIKWKDRVPYAYWRGNPHVSPTRADLLKCNVSERNDWNTRLYIQNWDKESKIGYKQSNLEDQCTHRYKIYVEGWAWSVSEKYILACDSMTLLVRPKFTDFFSRGMVPLQHYWPIRDNRKCTSLKFAVDWGNNHTNQAEAIGEAASKYIQEDMRMEYIYDYMFHLLNEYAKLLKFKPEVPPGATELCSETMACPAEGIWKKLMIDSLVKSPSDTSPCKLPPPYDPPQVKAFFDDQASAMRKVENWEDMYWYNRKE